jgi:hypothetical protein
MPQQKHDKDNPNERQSKESQSQKNESKPLAKKGDGKSKKNTRKWCETLAKSPDNCCLMVDEYLKKFYSANL